MKRAFLIIAIQALVLLGGIAAQADEPLPPPSTHSVVSQNSAFVAISDPEKGTRVLDNATRRELWSMPGWFRWLFVADDGVHVVTGYDGMNLIPPDAADDLVLLTFWENGKAIRRVPLKEIVSSRSILTRTVSHYHWGTIEGINAAGFLVVNRSDGRRLLFDVTTGTMQ